MKKTSKIFALFLLFLFLQTTSFSQNNTVETEASEFAELIKKARLVEKIEPDSALYYYGLAEKLITNKNSSQGAKVLFETAKAYWVKNNFAKALALIDEAINIAEKIDNKKLIIDSYSLKGSILRESGENGKAVEILIKAHDIAEENKLQSEKAWALNQLSETFRHLSEPYKAIDYQKKALSIYRKIGRIDSEANCLQSLANSYSSWSLKEFDTAILYFDTLMMPKYASTFSITDSARLFNNLGRVYALSGKKKQAEKYLFKSLELKEKINDKTGEAYTINELLTLYTWGEDYAKAKPFAEKALFLVDSIKQVYLKRNIYDRLQEYYWGVGDFKMAAAMADSARWIVENIFDVEKQATISEMEVKFQNKEELLKKENEISLLDKNNRMATQQRNFAIIGILLFAIFGYLFYSQRINKKKKEADLLEKRTTDLEELDKLKSRFFANISHELRTPLTLILGPVNHLLKNKNNYSDSEAKQLTTIQNSARNLKKIVEEILDLSKMDNHQLKVNLSTVNAKNYFNTLFASFESLAEIQKIDFQLNYFLPEKLNINIDKKKWAHIFNNVVLNAIKHTPENGKITVNISTTKNEEKIKLEIKDTGRGIHPDDLPHIFDRYFQSKQADAPVEGGTGIGLALSSELTKLMKGTLTAESELGKGSLFTLTLPLQKAELEAINLPIAEVATISNAKIDDQILTATPAKKDKATILLVEDNPDLRTYISGILTPYYQVEQAMNGKIGLEKLCANPGIQLVVSDVMMPEMDGFAMLKKIRADQKLLSIPVIMLTARADFADKMKALLIGVDDYLNKPFIEEELLVRIQNLLARAAQRTVLAKIEKAKDLAEEANISVSPADLKWLKEVESIAKREIKNAQFTLLQLADELHLSERQAHRRIKKITGLTPNKYFREIKLHEAQLLIEQGKFRTIAELSYAVGFDTPHYFSKLYYERFGVRPLEVSE